MIIINLKDLYASDSQQALTDKTNYNFNQLLRLGLGQPGPQGIQGIQGPQGIQGITGLRGTRGSYWYSGSYPSTPPTVPGQLDNDCYLTTASGNTQAWQLQSGNWVSVVDFDAIIQGAVSYSSPFVRTPGSPQPAGWANAILPLQTPTSGWNNTLLMAAENQSALYTGTYSLFNSIDLGRSQVSLLGTSDTNMPYSLMIGEVGYDYPAGKDALNPKVQINNTLRISAKYSTIGVVPSYSRGLFDMYTPDTAPSAYDVTTMMEFRTRRIGAVTGSLSAYFACKEALFSGYALNDLDDIVNASVDFGGLTLRNNNPVAPGASAIALGTNMNYMGVTPYAYLLTNSIVDRLYVNNHLVPLRISKSNLNIGRDGFGDSTLWNSLFIRNFIGYNTEDLRFSRNVGSPSCWSDAANIVMTLTSYGKVAIGNNIAFYNGVGDINALQFGASPSSGNNNNKAVLHIYEDVTAAPTVLLSAEAGLIVEKRWNILDTGLLTRGHKIGAHVKNVINVTDYSAGTGTAPDRPRS